MADELHMSAAFEQQLAEKVWKERTCGTCKHRGAPAGDDKPDYHRYPNSATFFLCGKINASTSAYQPEKDQAGEGAVVVDGSGYYAALCVESDFGCNKWEAK